MSELQQLRPGDTFAGRYRVVRLIRAGGMGAVYEVEDASTRRRRALKIMHPSLVQSADSRARFQREVFIGAELETEHVVEVIDAGLDPQSQMPFLTMELLKGEELGDRLGRMGRMSPQETIDVLAQVARALDKAHARGIVHRDLKPENVYLTFREDGSVRAKILDFGIAKLLEGANSSATQAAGTPLYMSPEQTDRAGHVSPATDVWALGLLAYRMIVGASYWQGESLQQLYRQILMDPITSAVQRAAMHGVQLPPAFDGWFLRCLARDPMQRFPAASMAVNELANAFGLQIQRISGVSHPNAQAYDQTAPPIAQSTPHPSYGQIPPPHAHTPPPGTTPYPAPQITPAPGPGDYGPVTTPMPHNQAAISGTQIAAPGDWRTSPVPPLQPAPPRKPSNPAPLVAAIAGALVVVGAIVAFVLIPKKPPPPPPPTPPTVVTKPPKDDPKPPTHDDHAAWKETAVKMNPLRDLGTMKVQLQEHEVTRAEYAKYLQVNSEAEKPLSGTTPTLDDKDPNVPMTWVSWEAADAYCKSFDARLPTAEEWDAAVRGPTSNKYPWGNAWPTGPELRDVAAAKGSSASPMDVEKNSLDRAPWGHYDLAGNVQEWTSSDSPQKGNLKQLRGTNISEDQTVFDKPGELLANSPGAAVSARADALVGFRCAKDK